MMKHTDMPQRPKAPAEIRKERMPTYRKIVRAMWILLGLGVLSVILLFVALSFSNLPNTEELENPKSKLASEVYASNGEVLGRYYIENRVPLDYEEISPYVKQALIATEDERFFYHSGIDSKALIRAVVNTAILGKRSSGGGSTITQQLAKLLFTGTPSRNVVARIKQKLKEWIIAVRLERKYTKQEIVAMYLNKFDFLNNADGIKAAAEIYFGKTQDSLQIQEAAMLVGMLKNPALFNPLRFPDTVKHRRMVVLSQMERNNIIKKEEYDSLRQLPLGVEYHRYTHIDGLAPYFRGELSKDLLFDILQREDARKLDGSKYDLYRDGLKIYTTIDPIVQETMEKAVMEHMADLQKKFDRHWKGMDPWKYRDQETTAQEMESRQRRLTRMIRETDRYKELRIKYLGETIESLQKEIEDFRYWDADIDRMLTQEEDDRTFDRLVDGNMISEKMASIYRRTMRSSYWADLKSKFEQLQEAVDVSFNTEVEMNVFTYENDSYEKDTVMTPLDSLLYHHHFLQIGSMAVDPTTGFVRGWVGGINYKYFKYDHVNSRRQVGSTFKPFVYATAIEQQGISPCFQVYDLAQTIYPEEGNFMLNEPWTPSNSDGKYSGELMTLKDGLRKSKNTISVFLMKQLMDTEPVRDLVHQMGIDKNEKYPNGRFVVPKAPSICLGATDLSVSEMTGAYTTFANNGVFNRPRFITKIEDRKGRIIYQNEPDERQALDERANYVMVDMLKNAGALQGSLKSEVGGKTGTTNDYVDGWFMGITPSLIVGTWVGGEDRWIRFRSIVFGQGSVMAKPVFKKVIKALEENPDANYDVKARFSVPQGDLGIELDCSRYQNIPTDNPDNQFNEYDEFEEDMFGDEAFQTKRDTTQQREF
jgi:penicillin-binding protein 1A